MPGSFGEKFVMLGKGPLFLFYLVMFSFFEVLGSIPGLAEEMLYMRIFPLSHMF